MSCVGGILALLAEKQSLVCGAAKCAKMCWLLKFLHAGKVPVDGTEYSYHD